MASLSIDKLKSLWSKRKQIFNDPQNEWILSRYGWTENLFNDIKDINIKFDQDKVFSVTKDGESKLIQGESKDEKGNDIKFYPCVDYFGTKEDGIPSDNPIDSMNIMVSYFPKYKNIISRIFCLLGGYNSTNHRMKDIFRIISNVATKQNDNGSLDTGRSQHPSSNLASNNYFFNVIYTINAIRDEEFDPQQSRFVLRYPNNESGKYYQGWNEADIMNSQRDTLRYKFPYKFFFMWTHEKTIHPLSLYVYQELVKNNLKDYPYKDDVNMDEDYSDFCNTWPKYSEEIGELIEPDSTKRTSDFYDELSKLITIQMIQDQDFSNIKDLISTGNKAVILYGPPGTGKTYEAKELTKFMLQSQDLKNVEFGNNIGDKGCVDIVQFHPNYTYEDFMGGITPSLNGETLAYTLKEGEFKKFCDTANKEENKSKKFIFIIDEINRADLSAVFGELLYALEYREEGITIPNFENKFIIPANVYLIGTMNNVDKSLVNFDLALRRRFSFFYMAPNLETIRNIIYNKLEAKVSSDKDSSYADSEDCKISPERISDYILRCSTINKTISDKNNVLQLGDSYQIGQAYFGKITDYLNSESSDISTFALEKLWRYNLEPLLKEYLGARSDDQEIKEELDNMRKEFTRDW